MEETAGEENERSVAAPIIFTIVIAFQFLSTYIQHKTKIYIVFGWGIWKGEGKGKGKGKGCMKLGEM
ncbi:hypothetical protein CsSME_00006050 [Camellia sinensis var. sinensis]